MDLSSGKGEGEIIFPDEEKETFLEESTSLTMEDEASVPKTYKSG